MAVLRSHARWKGKDFRGMTFEQIEAEFTLVWESVQNFKPMGSEEESKRFKRPRIQLEQRSSKRIKSAAKFSRSDDDDIPSGVGLTDEELKGMMELVPIEEVYIEALQVKRPIIGCLAQEVHEKGQLLDDKEKQLWVELKRLYEPDPTDQLWKIQRYMHDPLEWRLYDSCAVHHVATSRGHEIFMLVEKDYPLTKGLTTVMLSNKLQVENYSERANELLVKIYNIANQPR
ncbi:hypothetical protein Tco_0596792 [Tanacetum coccineum]